MRNVNSHWSYTWIQVKRAYHRRQLPQVVRVSSSATIYNCRGCLPGYTSNNIGIRTKRSNRLKHRCISNEMPRISTRLNPAMIICGPSCVLRGTGSGRVAKYRSRRSPAGNYINGRVFEHPRCYWLTGLWTIMFPRIWPSTPVAKGQSAGSPMILRRHMPRTCPRAFRVIPHYREESSGIRAFNRDLIIGVRRW